MGPFEFFESEGFYVAFLTAFVGSILVAGTVLLLRQRNPSAQVLPVAGLLGTGAAVVGLRATDAILGNAATLYLGLAALAVGGLVAGAASVPWPFRVAALTPGAVLVSDAAQSIAPSSGGWLRPVALAAVVLGGIAVADFDRHWSQSGLGPVLMAITAAGVYVCVPDTEQALAVLGGSAAVALLGWPMPLASLGSAGACTLGGLVVWTAAAGGAGRPGSIVGSIACLGVFVIEPVVRRLRPIREPETRGIWSRDSLTIVALHVVVVSLCARVAGLRSSATSAAVIAALVLAGAFAVLVVTRTRRDTPAAQEPPLR